MATQTETVNDGTNWGIAWYHIGFALALGIGLSIFPPSGTVTYLGWAAGTLGSITAGFIIAAVGFVAVRLLDEWRPHDLVAARPPDSRAKYAIFLAISIQLFLGGMAFSLGVSVRTLLIVYAILNPLIAVLIVIDMLRLRSREIAWESIEFGFPVLALILGSIGGLGYWYHRGRTRTRYGTT